jgi:exopolyphosphatase/guanosine-5'-triphosphate,3'-diphosphate pyrophosphatase
VAELVAVLDFGSNAARFLLARIKRGVGFRVLRKERVQTRLAGDAAGMLPRDAVSATLDATRDFLGRVRNGRNPRILAVATAAVRDAPNREALLRPLRRDEGVRVRILSGAEEARLSARAAIHSLPVREGLVADLGGGSLQLTRLRDGRIGSTASLPLGAVRMTRRFLRHDPPTPLELRSLRSEVLATLGASLGVARRGDDLVGLGGSVRELGRIHLRADPGLRFRHGLRLRQSDVTSIRERLEVLPVRKRRRIPGLKAERADILLAGAIVMEELMTLGGYLTLTVCTRGVWDGLLLRETFDGGGAP